MTVSKRLLRILIVAIFALASAGVVVSFLTEPLLPEPLREFLDSREEEDLSLRDWVVAAAVIPLILATMVSLVGLFFFWRPARTLYLVSMVAGFLVVPFTGPDVNTGWGLMFDQMAVFVSGVILALVYCSPLKDAFDKTGSTAAETAMRVAASAETPMPVDDRAVALRRAAPPAVGLVIVGGLQMALALLFALENFRDPVPARNVFAVIWLLAGIVVLIGGIHLKRLDSYTWVKVGSIVALIPCVTIWLGIPIGIRALVTAASWDVWKEFQRV